MNIHEHRVTITAASGSAASSTLRINGGLLRQMLVRANTSSTTVFSANLVDENSVTRANWGFHEGELNDMDVKLPMRGTYTINITNATFDDTFSVILGIQE